MLNILVFDNDETTGFYGHYMNYMWYILTMSDGVKVSLVELISVIINHCEKCNVFRHGLKDFLNEVRIAKETGKIDKVMMYTNYLETGSTIDVSGINFNYTEFLSACLGTLAGDISLFDIILTRLVKDETVIYPPKSFDRLRSTIEDRARFLFYEDKPEEVRDISSKDSLIKIEPYISPLNYLHLKPALVEIHSLVDIKWSFDVILKTILPTFKNISTKPVVHKESWENIWKLDQFRAWLI
jgi:hypothetical protein